MYVLVYDKRYISGMPSGSASGCIHVYPLVPRPASTKAELDLPDTLEGHVEQVVALLWLPLNVLMSAATDTTLRFWDLNTMKSLHVVE